MMSTRLSLSLLLSIFFLFHVHSVYDGLWYIFNEWSGKSLDCSVSPVSQTSSNLQVFQLTYRNTNGGYIRWEVKCLLNNYCWDYVGSSSKIGREACSSTNADQWFKFRVISGNRYEITGAYDRYLEMSAISDTAELITDSTADNASPQYFTLIPVQIIENYPCSFQILSNDHSWWPGESIGKYFNFNRTRVDCMLGYQYETGSIHTVFYSKTNEIRTVVIWRAANSANGFVNGSGRIEPINDAADNDWEVGEFVAFVNMLNIPCGCTLRPTKSPSIDPSDSPTISPTTAPTLPSSAPTNIPLATPTFPPTIAPSIAPSLSPSVHPTKNPSATPTAAPTKPPSNAPSTMPSLTPSLTPTQPPSIAPTVSPSYSPSDAPSLSPSISPTINPTIDPTIGPTIDPTIEPTINPTIGPTIDPTIGPTIDPTIEPTINPTIGPTIDPTIGPTIGPTINPTIDPTIGPTIDPTINPNMYPTIDPTIDPTINPTIDPTIGPTIGPTIDLTINPMGDPTIGPTVNPKVVVASQSADSTTGIIVTIITGIVILLSMAGCLYWKYRKDTQNNEEQNVQLNQMRARINGRN